MEFVRPNTRIDFMGQRRIAAIVSGVLMLISILSVAIQGLNFGIDFTGGTLVEVSYAEPVELDTVRQALSAGGFERVTVQHFGTTRDVLIRLAPQQAADHANLSNQILELLSKTTQNRVELRRVEFVGPQVGEELRDDGGLAMIYALIGILIYVSVRFEYRFAFGAVLATIHDVILTTGFISITRMEFDLTVLAAILTVIGYSLNDTIVVFDRIRDNFRLMRKADTMQIINASVNQTLSRTIMTGVTTLMVLLALFILGGETVDNFALTIIVGIVFGTYSSVYMASALTLWLKVSRADFLPVKKEGADLEKLP